jgi:hypothetical protein
MMMRKVDWCLPSRLSGQASSDLANALIIRAKEFQPFRDDLREEAPDKLVPKLIVTSDDVHRKIKRHPTQKIGTIQALFQAVRLGIGVFVKSYSKDGEESEREGENEYRSIT